MYQRRYHINDWLLRCGWVLLPFALLLTHTARAAPTTAPTTAPKVLIFSAVDSEYVADTLPFWGDVVGVNGFILSYLADWSMPKNEMFKHAEVLKKINTQGRLYDIDSNFIKVALGNGELPLWTDDKAWTEVIDHFSHAAELARQTGCKGIALDTEPYRVPLFDSKAPRFRSINRNLLKAKLYLRGREIMQALATAYPDIEVMILPEGAFYWFNPDNGDNPQAYELWIDFYNGMASVNNNQGIIVASERTYSITSRYSLDRVSYLINETMAEQVENPRAWQQRGSIAIGMWPLGKEYDNKAAHFSPAEFKRQFTKAVSLSPKYVWVYDHGSAWFQLKPSDVAKYNRHGPRLWGKDYQILPTAPDIDAYYAVLRDYKKARQLKDD